MFWVSYIEWSYVVPEKSFFFKIRLVQGDPPPPQFSAPIPKRQFSNYYMRTVSISYSVLGNSVKHPVDGKAFSHLFMYVSMNMLESQYGLACHREDDSKKKGEVQTLCYVRNMGISPMQGWGGVGGGLPFKIT